MFFNGITPASIAYHNNSRRVFLFINNNNVCQCPFVLIVSLFGFNEVTKADAVKLGYVMFCSHISFKILPNSETMNFDD